MFSVKLNFNEDLSNYSLIVPCVSVGNVGQLTADLLINSIAAAKIGYVHTAYLFPMVGADAFTDGEDGSNTGKLTTGCELFASTEHKLVIVQQRSPIMTGKSEIFRSELRHWIKEKRFKLVILMSSSFAHKRLDSQINDPFCRFLATQTADPSLISRLQSELKWKLLEQTDTSEVGDLFQDRITIPGGGIATKFHHECSEDGIPLLVIVKFCSEGDNIPDAIELASFLNSWLKIVPDVPNDSIASMMRPRSNWTLPSSWRLLFGSGPPTTMF